MFSSTQKESKMRSKYQKAKLKFVKNQVYSFYFCERGVYYPDNLDYYHSGKYTISSTWEGKKYQIMEQIAKMNFVQAFWKARKLANQSNSIWGFEYEKKIKI